MKLENLNPKEINCPFWGNTLTFNNDYSKSNCKDSDCRYNNDIDLSRLIPKHNEDLFKREYLCYFPEINEKENHRRTF